MKPRSKLRAHEIRRGGRWTPIKSGEVVAGMAVRPAQSNEVAGMTFVDDVWIERPLGRLGTWLIAYRLALVGKRYELSEIRILPNEKGRPRAGEWRAAYQGIRAVPRVPFSWSLTNELTRRSYLAAKRELLENVRRQNAAAAFHNVIPETLPAKSREVNRGGRPPMSMKFLAEFAVEYDEIENRRPRESRSSIGLLAAKRGLSRQTIAAWIARARQEGLLEASRRGRRGGRATPRAVALAGVTVK